MKRIGYVKIRKDKNRRHIIYCRNCGGPGEFKVTFRDRLSTAVVVLCKNCLWMEYEELLLQSRLKFPLTDK